jgi:hypothetical protein
MITNSSAPAAPPLIHPIYRRRQPLVGCCVLLLNGDHLRPRPQPSLSFSMGLVLTPQSMEPATARAHQMPRPCYRPIGSKSAKIWVHGGCCHGERETKQLESRAAAAHIGCCVLWLCFVLWLMVECCILPILYSRAPHPC